MPDSQDNRTGQSEDSAGRDSQGQDEKGQEKKESRAADSDDGSLMYVVCCRCHKFLEVRPGPIEAMTHTYCDDCYKAMMAEIDGVLKSKDKRK